MQNIVRHKVYPCRASEMDVLPNELLALVLSKLDVTCLFQVMLVSRKWKDLCQQQIGFQKRLSVRNLYAESLFPLSREQHFVPDDLVPGAIAAVRNKSCWAKLFQLLPSLVSVHVDCEAALFTQSLLAARRQTLQCLLCPNWTFLCDWPLPELLVLAVDSISDASFRRLISTSPKLASIRFSRTDFRDWELLPKSVISVTGGELDDRPFDRLFKSAAAEALQLLTLRCAMLHLSGSYRLHCLRELEVAGVEELNDNQVLNWAETLSSCKHLQHLHISSPIEKQHLTAAVLWNVFFSSVPSINSIYWNLRCHRVDPMFQIISSLVNNCVLLEDITLPYSNIADSDIEVVSRLPVLKRILLYSNSGPVTEKGVLALLTGACAGTLSYIHVYNNYKEGRHMPSMLTAAVKQRLDLLQETAALAGATLQYQDKHWRTGSRADGAEEQECRSEARHSVLHLCSNVAAKQK